MTRRIARRQSPIHGNGVFALVDIPKGERVIEYRGKRLTHAQANRAYGGDADSGHTFLFTLNEKYLLDANQGGNVARWINHSCSPNCQAWVIESEDKDPKRDRVVIETKRAIRAGEELTYDYGITLDEPHTARMKAIWACRCGSKCCTGTILKPKRAK
ncbi:MAG TPA: SET domain-containing protein-lysine N-methyltransferase [Rudaea sp.]